MEWIVQLPILFFSVMFHEVSHGWMALRHGDDTALRAGRLNFNPVAHVDPIGTLLLPLFCLLARIPMIGWAKPVPVSPHRLRTSRAIVSVAMIGPVSNLALGLGAALVFKLFASFPAVFPGFIATLLSALMFAVQINLLLAFFNLVPIHPLDGSKVLSGLLPSKYRLRYERHQPYGFVIILVMIYTGAIGPLVMVPSSLAMGILQGLGLIW